MRLALRVYGWCWRHPDGVQGRRIALPQAEAWGYRYCSPSGAHTHADTLSLTLMRLPPSDVRTHTHTGVPARWLLCDCRHSMSGRTPTLTHCRRFCRRRDDECVHRWREARREEGIGEGRARRRCAVLLTPGFSPGKRGNEDCAPSGRRPHRPTHADSLWNLLLCEEVFQSVLLVCQGEELYHFIFERLVVMVLLLVGDIGNDVRQVSYAECATEILFAPASERRK